MAPCVAKSSAPIELLPMSYSARKRIVSCFLKPTRHVKGWRYVFQLCWEVDITSWKLRTAYLALQWRHNERDGVSNHRRLHCLYNCWFRHRSKKTSKLSVTGLCAGNSPVTSEFPSQKASNAENVSLWWRHHAIEIQNWYSGFSMTNRYFFFFRIAT